MQPPARSGGGEPNQESVRVNKAELLQLKEELEAARDRCYVTATACSAASATYFAGRGGGTAYDDVTTNFSAVITKLKATRAAYETACASLATARGGDAATE